MESQYTIRFPAKHYVGRKPINLLLNEKLTVRATSLVSHRYNFSLSEFLNRVLEAEVKLKGGVLSTHFIPPRASEDQAMDQLERIEAKVDRLTDRLLNGPESPTVNAAGAMFLMGIKPRNYTSFYELCRELNVRPYAHGKYRRRDIMNAINSRALLRQKAHQVAAESELKTEAQRKPARINPDND